jgi:hypothetical protein
MNREKVSGVAVAMLLWLGLLGSGAFVPAARADYVIGDGFVDSLIFNYNSKGGRVDTGWVVNPYKYAPNPNACNRYSFDGFEGRCPNDSTYTPSYDTGGYQAWGAGLQNYEGGYYYQNVYYVCWDYNGDLGYTYTICWDTYWTYVPPYVEGRVATHLKWGRGANGVNAIPRSSGYYDSSTLAFTGDDQPACSFYDLDFSGGMICAPPLTDRVYVPDAGYEDKVAVPNPSCPPSRQRAGDYTDRYYGCFYAESSLGSASYTNLPAPYVDTTFTDSAPTYVASMGSAYAAGIVPGQMYYATIYFWAYGNPQINGNGPTAHVGAVTMASWAAVPLCPGGFQACARFNVDSVKVSDDAVIDQY